MSSYELLSILLTLACSHVDAEQANLNFSASSNPAYDGFNVTLTCVLSGGGSPEHGNSGSSSKYFIVMQKNTSLQDFARCDTSNGAPTANGLFGPAMISCDSRSLIVSFLATATSAGNYECRAEQNSLPQALELKVFEAPSPPKIQPSYLTFNDSDPMLINCTSTNGNPPAEIELKITTNGNIIMNCTATAQKSVLLRVNASIELHEAIVTCQVKNHLLPNMTAASNIKVNHIFLRPGLNASQSALDSEVLNCSKLVDSFPLPVFAWSNRSASTVTTLASSGSFGPVGNTDFLSCNATNKVLQKSVSVTFYIIKGTTTILPVTSLSRASAQTTASSTVTKTITSTPQFLSWTPAITSGGATTNAMTSRPSSSQGNSLSISVTGSVSSDIKGPQNNDPSIIGVAMSVSLFSAAVVIAIVILRFCRMRLSPPRNLPASVSTSKIIGESQLPEIQGDDAKDIVCMADNDLYGSNPPLCAANKSSIIYDEPYQRQSVCSTLLYTSQDKDSHGLSIRPQECGMITQHNMDDRSAASSRSESLEVHPESSGPMSEGTCSAPLEVSSTPIRIAASVRAPEPPCDQLVSQQCFTKGKPSHNKSFENMAYMAIQLAESNAPEDFSPQEE